MIVVDTSALIAILLWEPEGFVCESALWEEDDVLISAGTLTETLIVAGRQNAGAALRVLLDELDLTVVPLDARAAGQAADAYDRWGKGVHPARLNLADCFAYALAKERDLPLLFVGNDFAQTDVKRALPPHPGSATPPTI